MDKGNAKLINCMLKRIRNLEKDLKNINSKLYLKDFAAKNFNESDIKDAFDQLRVYFKKDDLLVGLIGIDETLLSDANFKHSLSSVSQANGTVKHYSSETSVINNYYDELDDSMKSLIDLINDIDINLIVNNKLVKHVVCSFNIQDLAFFRHLGYGVKLYIDNSFVFAFGNDDNCSNECSKKCDYQDSQDYNCSENCIRNCEHNNLGPNIHNNWPPKHDNPWIDSESDPDLDHNLDLDSD